MDLMNSIEINIREKSNLIWSIADKLVGVYKPYEYGKVILPMTILKRFNDILAPTKEKVLAIYENMKDSEIKESCLKKASGYYFYNISKYDFQKLLDDSNNLEINFKSFLNGFSENVKDIFLNFEFEKEIEKLLKNDLLYSILEEFNKDSAYMGIDKITTIDIGYIFEDLVRRFSENYNEQAGAHFTSRDIIYLMTDLLISEDNNIKKGGVKTVYDMTMGTSQMLTCMTERIVALDPEADIKLYGQEINPESYAIAKADMLIRGKDSENMKLGNTLSDDKFSGYKFDYIISNPPFGIEWKVERKAVEDEAKKRENGRFSIGLPKISDGQMLFDLNGIAKLKDTGRMAIIHNGSSLFTGSAGSGESEIRRYIIENDWLEAIVQLPNDSFYNTGITTYIWIITKNKSEHRKGKIQLIDASNMYDNRRKSIGNKKVDITEKYRDMVVRVHREFLEKEYEIDGKICESKIFKNEEFGFYRVQIETPLYNENGDIIMKGKKIVSDTNKRDYENIPFSEDLDEYFEREIKVYNPEGWIDKTKTKIGYEILFTRYFYKYKVLESSDTIAQRIFIREKEIMDTLNRLFSKEDNGYER